ncbi:MAG: ribonuclease Z [Candidatus Methanofastidiosia archaeon]
MKLIFLGTAASKPTLSRNLTAIALQFEGEVILFDCGEGTQRQMLRRVSPSKISNIFISHFHGDHYLGLGGLLHTLSLNKREKPLNIFGPENTKNFLQSLFSSGYFGINFKVRLRELGNTKLEFEKYFIHSFKVEHGVPTLGYLFSEKDKRGKFLKNKAESLGIKGRMFKELEIKGRIEVEGREVLLEDVTGKMRKGKKIVYSSDTKPCKALENFAKDADVLIHEATFMSEEEREGTFHTTVKEACELAGRCNVGKLVLTHFSQRYSQEEISKEAKRYFENVIVAEDFLELEI